MLGGVGMTFRVAIAELSLPCPRPMRFGAFEAANLIRGQFGKELFQGHAELYRLLFAPPRRETGPSGLADPPRPFVLRTRHLDGRGFAAGEELPFRVHLFDSSLAQYFPVKELVLVDLGNSEDWLDLELRFWTPTELRGATPGAFGALARRLRDRLSTLARLYQGQEYALDYRDFGAAADAVETVEAALVPQRLARRGHELRGYTGWARYRGDLGRFVPWLRAGQWAGVGRHTVWGQGEIGICRRDAQLLAEERV